MNAYDKSRSVIQLSGNGADQSIDIEARYLLERALFYGTGDLKLNGKKLPVTTDPLMVPITSTDSLVFNAASGVDLTLVLVLLQ